MHMVQHILLGDLAPLLLRARPDRSRPAAGPLASGRARRLRFLLHPLVALPLWAAQPLYLARPVPLPGGAPSQRRPRARALLLLHLRRLMWAPVVEALPGPEWFGTGAKLGYIAASCGWSRRSSETCSSGRGRSSTRSTSAQWGSPLSRPQIAGAAMMVEGSLVTLGALAWLFLRWRGERAAPAAARTGTGRARGQARGRYGRAGVLETE